MKHLLLLSMALIFSTVLVAQEKLDSADQTRSIVVHSEKTADNESDEEPVGATTATNKVLNALISYNFSGNNKAFSNLTPVIDYGWSKDLVPRKNNFTWTLSMNPYTAGQIAIEDSTTFLPALMLPGVAGLRINSFLRFHTKKAEVVIAAPNFGFKVLSNFNDTITTIAQHNFRAAVGFRMEQLFMIGVQYTWAWHNLTSESEEAYQKLFKRSATDLSYITITLQTKLTAQDQAKVPTYIFIEWRAVTNTARYDTYDNNKILTVGIRSDLSWERLVPAKGSAQTKQKTSNFNWLLL